MPRYAPELECSVEDKASLVALAKSRTAEAQAVERARIILACLEGKEDSEIGSRTEGSAAYVPLGWASGGGKLDASVYLACSTSVRKGRATFMPV